MRPWILRASCRRQPSPAAARARTRRRRSTCCSSRSIRCEPIVSGRTATAPHRHPRSTRSPGAACFANATSVGVLTLPAHTSLMTGTVPSFTASATTADSMSTTDTTLAEILRERGYRTGASSARSCSIAAGDQPGLRSHSTSSICPAPAPAWTRFSDPDRRRRSRAGLARRGREPTVLAWVHLTIRTRRTRAAGVPGALPADARWRL